MPLVCVQPICCAVHLVLTGRHTEDDVLLPLGCFANLHPCVQMHLPTWWPPWDRRGCSHPGLLQTPAAALRLQCLLLVPGQRCAASPFDAGIWPSKCSPPCLIIPLRPAAAVPRHAEPAWGGQRAAAVVCRGAAPLPAAHLPGGGGGRAGRRRRRAGNRGLPGVGGDFDLCML